MAQECAEMGWGQFKPLLTETAIAALEPIQAKYAEILADRGELDRIIQAGNAKASQTAQQTLARVRDALGFLAPPY